MVSLRKINDALDTNDDGLLDGKDDKKKMAKSLAKAFKINITDENDPNYLNILNILKNTEGMSTEQGSAYVFDIFSAIDPNKETSKLELDGTLNDALAGEFGDNFNRKLKRKAKKYKNKEFILEGVNTAKLSDDAVGTPKEAQDAYKDGFVSLADKKRAEENHDTSHEYYAGLSPKERKKLDKSAKKLGFFNLDDQRMAGVAGFDPTDPDSAQDYYAYRRNTDAVTLKFLKDALDQGDEDVATELAKMAGFVSLEDAQEAMAVIDWSSPQSIHDTLMTSDEYYDMMPSDLRAEYEEEAREEGFADLTEQRMSGMPELN